MGLAVDDAVLLDAARAGDAEAFVEIVRRHEALVYRIAFRMLGCDADAQDAAQETFVRAWRSLDGFRGESSSTTWLCRIVTNHCLSQLKRARQTVLLRDDLPGRVADPARIAEQTAHVAAVTAAVAQLPADQRAALVLRDYEGLTYGEIAEVLQINTGAVKSRIHRARSSVLTGTLGWR